MTCREAGEMIEAVAAGDLVPDDRFEAHVAQCGACSAALQTARRIEQALTGMPVMAAPVRFSQHVDARLRRERWRSEERVDRAFNLTIAAAIVVVAVAAVTLLNLTTMVRLLLSATDALTRISAQPVRWNEGRALPAIAIAAFLLATAGGVWVWAERRFPYRES